MRLRAKLLPCLIFFSLKSRLSLAGCAPLSPPTATLELAQLPDLFDYLEYGSDGKGTERIPQQMWEGISRLETGPSHVPLQCMTLQWKSFHRFKSIKEINKLLETHYLLLERGGRK